jgi:ABC-type transport system involved in cytochrome c biogenesis ATPase subunit
LRNFYFASLYKFAAALSHAVSAWAVFSAPLAGLPQAGLPSLRRHFVCSRTIVIMTTPSLLQIRQLCFKLPERFLIDHLSADLPAGVTIVRGGDGRGKTTLLRLLAGAEQAHEGNIYWQEQAAELKSPAWQAQVYYVDPRTEAYDQMSVPAYFDLLRQRFERFDDTILPALIEGLALTPHWDKQLFMLSTGSKRKVYLAGAFAAGAMVTLLDDPFAGLDQSSINFVCRTLNAVTANPATPQVWLASFYEVPAAITAVALLDLGD